MCHEFNTYRVSVKHNKCYSAILCMCNVCGHKNRWRQRSPCSLTLRATIMSLHNLKTNHPHPSMTHRERIRWTASITWHYTLLLQALSAKETRSGALCFPPLCVYWSVFFNLGGVSIQSAAVGKAGIAPVCQRDVLKSEQWPMKRDTTQVFAVDKFPLQFTTWINQPHLQTNTEINPNSYHTWRLSRNKLQADMSQWRAKTQSVGLARSAFPWHHNSYYQHA